jgi:hypothetical protein
MRTGSFQAVCGVIAAMTFARVAAPGAADMHQHGHQRLAGGSRRCSPRTGEILGEVPECSSSAGWSPRRHSDFPDVDADRGSVRVQVNDPPGTVEQGREGDADLRAGEMRAHAEVDAVTE